MKQNITHLWLPPDTRCPAPAPQHMSQQPARHRTRASFTLARSRLACQVIWSTPSQLPFHFHIHFLSSKQTCVRSLLETFCLMLWICLTFNYMLMMHSYSFKVPQCNHFCSCGILFWYSSHFTFPYKYTVNHCLVFSP